MAICSNPQCRACCDERLARDRATLDRMVAEMQAAEMQAAERVLRGNRQMRYIVIDDPAREANNEPESV